MTFVGTRPDVKKYVDAYTEEMNATLLLPAGITSEASIQFKDEDRLLSTAVDIDYFYINEVLPKKMIWNLDSIINFSLIRESKLLFKTIAAVVYDGD